MDTMRSLEAIFKGKLSLASVCMLSFLCLTIQLARAEVGDSDIMVRFSKIREKLASLQQENNLSADATREIFEKLEKYKETAKRKSNQKALDSNIPVQRSVTDYSKTNVKTSNVLTDRTVSAKKEASITPDKQEGGAKQASVEYVMQERLLERLEEKIAKLKEKYLQVKQDNIEKEKIIASLTEARKLDQAEIERYKAKITKLERELEQTKNRVLVAETQVDRLLEKLAPYSQQIRFENGKRIKTGKTNAFVNNDSRKLTSARQKKKEYIDDSKVDETIKQDLAKMARMKLGSFSKKQSSPDPSEYNGYTKTSARNRDYIKGQNKHIAINGYRPKNPTTALDMPVVAVTAKKAYLRAGPAKNHSPVMVVKRGSLLAVERELNGWFRVITPTGGRAWISGEVVALKPNGSNLTRYGNLYIEEQLP